MVIRYCKIHLNIIVEVDSTKSEKKINLMASLIRFKKMAWLLYYKIYFICYCRGRQYEK